MLILLNESLWGDEGFSALAVMQNFWEMLGVVMRDTAPPGFYVVGWLWGRLFGFSEIALRSLTLLLMLGAAVFAGLIVYRINRDKVTAILTGMLAFFSPFSFPFAFEWRMYALLTFAIMGSVYFFIARKWKSYVVLTLIALYTHHFGLFTLAAEGLWFLLVERPKHLIKGLWPFWLIVLGYSPWLYPMYLQTTRVQGAGFWLSAPSVNDLKAIMERFITGGVREAWLTLVKVLVAVLLAFKNWKKTAKVWLELTVVILVPVGLSFVVSHLVTPIFYDRYLLSVVLGMAVLWGLGLNRRLIPVLLILVLIYTYSSYRLLIEPKKKPFREFAWQVKQELRPGDQLVNYNGKAHHLWETKYYGIPAPIWTPGGPLPLWVGTAQMKPEDTIVDLPTAERLGVITSDPSESVSLPDTWQLEQITEVDGLRVLWFLP
ncbi:MAG: hypothetical protein Q8P47_01080 [Candidatus Beckwithbacteria bacterium]|nr:hypothetical protein [Candidatus Beckwithbacteria bacterium]